MDIRDVKKNLNRRVRFSDSRLYIEGTEYILSGCIIRSNGTGFYYQAELTDTRCENSLLICGLENIEEVKL